MRAWRDCLNEACSKRHGVELLVCCLILLPSLLYPLARDQGLFSYAGQVIVDGGAPYRDVYEQKGPATHYTFALLVALFGTTTVGIRLFFFVVALIGSQLAAAIGQKLIGDVARLPCAACYALVSLQAHPLGPWMFGQVEDVILPLMLGAVLLLHTPQRAARWLNLILAAGAMGLAFAYKPTVILPSIAIAAVSIRWTAAYLKAWPPVLWRVAVAGIAYTVPAALFALYLQRVGALDDLWVFLVEHNLQVYSKLYSGTARDAWLVFTTYFGGVGLLAACGAGIGRGRAPMLWSLLWVLIASSLAMVFWQWKFFILYHWTVLVGTLSIVAGLSLGKMRQWGRAETKPFLQRQFLAGLALVACLTTAANVPFYGQMILRSASYFAGRQTLDGFRAPYRVGAASAAATYGAADYIRSKTQNHDTLLVWGYDVVVNYLSERRSPSRFAMTRVLQRAESPHVEAWREEFIRDLRDRQPAYIVVADEKSTAPFIGNPREHFERFAELRELVEDNYEFETRIGSFDLYRVKADRGTKSIRPI